MVYALAALIIVAVVMAGYIAYLKRRERAAAEAEYVQGGLPQDPP